MKRLFNFKRLISFNQIIPNSVYNNTISFNFSADQKQNETLDINTDNSSSTDLILVNKMKKATLKDKQIQTEDNASLKKSTSEESTKESSLESSKESLNSSIDLDSKKLSADVIISPTDLILELKAYQAKLKEQKIFSHKIANEVTYSKRDYINEIEKKRLEEVLDISSKKVEKNENTIDNIEKMKEKHIVAKLSGSEIKRIIKDYKRSITSYKLKLDPHTPYFRGDTVKIINGEHKNKSGKVLKVDIVNKTVSVRGVNDLVISNDLNKILFKYTAYLFKQDDDENPNKRTEEEEIKRIKKQKTKSFPIDIKYIRLISPYTRSPIEPIVKMQNGNYVRICPESNKIIKFNKTQKSYVKAKVNNSKNHIFNIRKKLNIKERKVPRDYITSEEIGSIKTFKGNDYSEVVVDYLARIKDKRVREKSFVLKDNFSKKERYAH